MPKDLREGVPRGRGHVLVTGLLVLALLGGCARGTAPATRPATGALKVVAAEAFLADIAQHVAGDRATVGTLIPPGLDPHAYEPTPADLARIAESDVLIINGAGLEEFLEDVLRNVGGERVVIEAAAGLISRQVEEDHGAHGHEEGDPHFWLDPNNVVRYVENIRAGLSQADPAGAAVYSANAEAYVTKLRELDEWVVAQVSTVPDSRRLLVTNHESLGYFADRYGFRVVGTIIPSVSTGASPSAQQLAALVDAVKATGVPAVFLETGGNPQLAQQLAREAGVRVVELYTHSPPTSGTWGSGYLGMMRYNVEAIVQALK